MRQIQVSIEFTVKCRETIRVFGLSVEDHSSFLLLMVKSFVIQLCI